MIPGIDALFEVGKMAISRIWPDPQQQAVEQRKLAELAQSGDLARMNAEVDLLLGQIEINKIEAQSESMFKSAWRPFIGWVCGFSLAYAAVLEPFMRFVAVQLEYDGTFPVIDTDITLQVLMGLLGLGAYRSYEKVKKVN